MNDVWMDFPPDGDGYGLPPEPLYVICQSNTPDLLFWPNDDGFGDLASATRFTSEEMRAYTPPIDGFWTSLERAEELSVQ